MDELDSTILFPKDASIVKNLEELCLGEWFWNLTHFPPSFLLICLSLASFMWFTL